MKKKRAIIIGAGPAGLTAAYELLKHADIEPIVLEMSEHMGGIARTINYKGNRIDIGGHRFFSKSDRVMQWWLDILPLEALSDGTQTITYQRKTRTIETGASGPNPDEVDEVMLLRSRLSRIYFNRTFFDYPLKLTVGTMRKLGFVRMVRIGMSYLYSCLFQRKEHNLEDFFINRFGNELYRTFFKSYTEKVWGIACDQISAEWGAQRIKGLSVGKALAHLLKSMVKKRSADVAQKDTETSLIEQFLYPKYGPGQMWDVVRTKIEELGGQVLTGFKATKVHVRDNKVIGIEATDVATGRPKTFLADYVFSTMPVKELIHSMQTTVPAQVQQIADGLMYRDFITVGLLVKRLAVQHMRDGLIKDNWIYIQEGDVQLGRLQIFNNWSPYMVKDPDTVWLGLEYFCNESDPIWHKSEQELITLGAQELAKIGIIDADDVLDGTVLKVPKAYPAYFGSYDQFDHVRDYLDGFENLYLIGRNGMHRYNNQDHSMLAAMTAVEHIKGQHDDKIAVWQVNTEKTYHESKQAEGK